MPYLFSSRLTVEAKRRSQCRSASMRFKSQPLTNRRNRAEIFVRGLPIGVCVVVGLSSCRGVLIPGHAAAIWTNMTTPYFGGEAMSASISESRQTRRWGRNRIAAGNLPEATPAFQDERLIGRRRRTSVAVENVSLRGAGATGVWAWFAFIRCFQNKVEKSTTCVMILHKKVAKRPVCDNLALKLLKL